ncbi:MAG TPA: DUF4340 domain-containing protein [Bacteroidales bacterium]|nr:DUF4340 domain-containing protein [Bacteroidales bacterium]
MSNKINNKTLLIVLAGLIIVFVLVKWYQKTQTESTLNTALVKIDTTKVSRIAIYPVAENRQEILFSKIGKDWKVSKGNITAEVDENVINNLIITLSEIKVKSLVAKNKDKWDDFKVSDTTATRVKVFEGNDVVADLMIGRFTYQQSQNPYGGMYGGGVIGSTYVRPADEDEVYAVDGFLTFTFNQQFTAFRKQTLARFETNKIEKITFKYPADSSYTLELKDKKWFIGDKMADSAKVASYISALSYKNASSFVDNQSALNAPAWLVRVEGKDMQPVSIEASSDGSKFIINSTQNPKSYFESAKNKLFDEIFKPQSSFFATKEKKKK